MLFGGVCVLVGVFVLVGLLLLCHSLDVGWVVVIAIAVVGGAGVFVVIRRRRS